MTTATTLQIISELMLKSHEGRLFRFKKFKSNWLVNNFFEFHQHTLLLPEIDEKESVKIAVAFLDEILISISSEDNIIRRLHVNILRKLSNYLAFREYYNNVLRHYLLVEEDKVQEEEPRKPIEFDVTKLPIRSIPFENKYPYPILSVSPAFNKLKKINEANGSSEKESLKSNTPNSDDLSWDTNTIVNEFHLNVILQELTTAITILLRDSEDKTEKEVIEDIIFNVTQKFNNVLEINSNDDIENKITLQKLVEEFFSEVRLTLEKYYGNEVVNDKYLKAVFRIANNLYYNPSIISSEGIITGLWLAIDHYTTQISADDYNTSIKDELIGDIPNDIYDNVADLIIPLKTINEDVYRKIDIEIYDKLMACRIKKNGKKVYDVVESIYDIILKHFNIDKNTKYTHLDYLVMKHSATTRSDCGYEEFIIAINLLVKQIVETHGANRSI